MNKRLIYSVLSVLVGVAGFAQTDEPSVMSDLIFDLEEDTTAVTSLQDIIDVQNNVVSRNDYNTHLGEVWQRAGYFNLMYHKKSLFEITVPPSLSGENDLKGLVFNAKYSFKTWLYTIGRNVAIDYLRHNAKQSDTSFDDFENYIQDEFDLEKLYIIEERKIAVHRALKKLNAEYRQVLWLLYFDGMTNSDAAVVMKKNTRQMKNLVYRAKSALKSELDKEGFVYEEL